MWPGAGIAEWEPEQPANPHPQAYCPQCGGLKPCVAWIACSPLCAELGGLMPPLGHVRAVKWPLLIPVAIGDQERELAEALGG